MFNTMTESRHVVTSLKYWGKKNPDDSQPSLLSLTDDLTLPFENSARELIWLQN